MAAGWVPRWWAVGTLVATSVCGCFFYDSRWAENAAEKKRAVARLHPAALGSDRPHAGLAHVALVRAYATRAYAAETVNWEQQFDALLGDANRVLEPALGLTLKNGGTSLWEPESGESEPTIALDALTKEDSGEGADWVAGFLQSVPKLVTDYHRLGVGRLMSKYVVMRGSADPKELDALGTFDTGEAERQKLYSERRRHKIVAVFLHELGHTLGATHRTARDTLMSPMYDATERGFDGATLGVLKVSLPHHLSGAPYRAAPEVLALLEKDDGGWVGSDREGWLDILRRMTPAVSRELARNAEAPATTSSTPAPAPAPTTTEPTVTPLPFTSMTRQDRATFDAALDSEKNGDSKSAWTAALPLFDAYPRVVEVQELRCRLAKTRHFISGVVYVHCSRLAALGKPTE
jgi:hypothetical protein